MDKDNLARCIMAVRALRSVQSASDGERSAGACGETKSGIKVVDARAKRDDGGDGSRIGEVFRQGGERGVAGPLASPQKCACVAQ